MTFLTWGERSQYTKSSVKPTKDHRISKLRGSNHSFLAHEIAEIRKQVSHTNSTMSRNWHNRKNLLSPSTAPCVRRTHCRHSADGGRGTQMLHRAASQTGLPCDDYCSCSNRSLLERAWMSPSWPSTFSSTGSMYLCTKTCAPPEIQEANNFFGRSFLP